MTVSNVRNLGFVVLCLMTGGLTHGQEPDSEDRSPLFKSTPLDGYFDFKNELHEETGFTWALNYSAMGVQRTDDTKDKSYTGQTDIILLLDAFNNRGKFTVYYMDVQQLSGISTSEFGNRNGNITPITDSDEVGLLRQAWYRHSFLDERFKVTVGLTEPILAFAGQNRFALDDRVNFMVAPLNNAAVKDRLSSSLGTIIEYHPRQWLSLYASVNELDEIAAGDQTPEDGQFYWMVNATFKVDSERWGEGNYRVTLVNSEKQGQFEESNGVIASLDQDISQNWGIFARYDDTEFQTFSSGLKQSSAIGFFNSSPFGRSRDDFGIGLFRTKSNQGGQFRETGGEMFYRLRIAEWMRVSLTVQYFEPAKAQGSFFNAGGRVAFQF
jgi:hypothetical protein